MKNTMKTMRSLHALFYAQHYNNAHYFASFLEVYTKSWLFFFLVFTPLNLPIHGG